MIMVEWKKLGEIAKVSNGERPSSEILEKGKYPYINAGRTNSGYLNEYNSKRGAVTTPSHGEGGIGSVLYQEKDFWCGALCYRMYAGDLINAKYLFHYLSNNSELIISCKNVGGQPYINRKQLEGIPICIPPLSEQQRIVGILDTFTSSIDNLKEQIAQRRKQYEYYRDQLLDLEGKPGVEMKTLGEICDIKGRIGFRGYTREDQVAKGEGVVSLSPGNIENGKMTYDVCTHITWKKYYESPEIMTFDGDIIFCKTGSTVGKVAMVNNLPCEATINPQLVVLKNVSVNSSFLNNSLGSFRIQSIVKRLAGVGSVPNISQEKLGNLEILLPSLQEQQRIVTILDTFEASIQNLEAQLKEREKQYEYYRNKLLTFE